MSSAISGISGLESGETEGAGESAATEDLNEDEVQKDDRASVAGDDDLKEISSELNKYMYVYDQTFDKIQVPAEVLKDTSEALQAFIVTQNNSKEAAGDAIFNAIFEAAPSLQTLFKSPRPVIALKFCTALTNLLNAASKPGALKTAVETIGFQHLDVEVTGPRMDVFREAILELFEQELGPKLTTNARFGFQLLLNYTGGALIFIRREYASRIRIIQNSWKSANKKAAGITDVREVMASPKKGANGLPTEKMEEDSEADVDLELAEMTKNTEGMMVPNSFNDMFLFNAAVMGLSNNDWMNLILDQLDAIALNVANPYRLQEECDVLALVLSRYTGNFVLSEFKAVVLASLRSLVSTEWDSDHEVAWNWLWQNVERLLKQQLGKPPVHEKALTDVLSSLPEASMTQLRQDFFLNFFRLAPTGQDFFKQSLTRLYFIADKIIELCSEIYRQPRAMVEDISGLGLRHVGYAIPAELFAPFVGSAVEVFSAVTSNETAISGFTWAMQLVSKILVRAISEGSTVVMKAISTNDEISMKKAMATSPRGKRAQELLNISVGAQSISPFYWSIRSGNLNSAKAILQDLLTIRADRDVYYFACDDLFVRHPDVVKYLMTDVPALLHTLFEGLVWRSRWISKGQRRVNYYVKHLVQDLDGQPSETLSWLEDYGDPKLISHETVIMVTDILWEGIKFRFLRRKIFFLFSMCLFLVSQSILSALERTSEIQTSIFTCRTIIYATTVPKLLYDQVKLVCDDCKSGYVKRSCRIPIPQSLLEWQGGGSLILLWLLIVMCTLEPFYWCIASDTEELFSDSCEQGQDFKRVYSTFSCLAMMTYWSLLLSLSVFHMRLSAFILVCGRVTSEVGLFLLAFVFTVLASATSITALDQSIEDFKGIPRSFMALTEIALNLFPGQLLDEMRHEEVLVAVILIFCLVVTVFLFSLFIAQLNQAYQHGFEDMQGYARLNRVSSTVAELEVMSAKPWEIFLASLCFDQPLEFNEGDVGVSGGVQVTEPANYNPTSIESIRRYGGSTAPTMPWPEEPGDYGAEDKFEKLEKLIIRTTKNLGKGRDRHSKHSSVSGASGALSSVAVESSEGGDSANSS